MFANLLGSFTLLALAAATIGGVNAVDYTFNVGNANLAPDGFSRSTVVVNGQFPGPLITANKGEIINVCHHSLYLRPAAWFTEESPIFLG